MRKNVLVSILAMTSATPLTALANANLDNIKADESSWGIESSTTVGIENGLLVSTDGTPVSQAIGSLVPGKYKLTGDLTNAKILVNGDELDANSQFELKATTDVTVTIEAVVTGQQYSAGNLKLELVYDFAASRESLSQALAEVTNLIYDGDSKDESLISDASAIAADINKLVNEDGTDAHAVYDLYVSTKLYEGVENSTLMTRINELRDKVTDVRSNAEAYDNAVNRITEKEELLKNTYDAIQSIVEDATYGDGTKTYAESLAKGPKAEADAIISAYKKEAEDAFTLGTAGTVCTEERNDKFAEDVDGKVKEISDAIAAAQLNQPAYNQVNDRIEALRAAIVKAQQDLNTLMQGDEAHPDVFNNLLNQAIGEITAVSIDVNAVMAANGTKESHNNAAENLTANLAQLTECETTLSGLVDEYTKKVNTIKANYADATAKVAALEESLKPLTEIADVAEKFSEEISKIQSDITTLKADIETAYGDYSIETTSFDTRITAVETSINTLRNNSADAVANYEAYTRVQESVATVQEAFDKAKAEVAKLASEDGKYKAEGKYTATETNLQNEITKYLTDAKAAYDGGTCVDWETNNSANITATGTKVATYQADAEAALAAYETATDKIAEYTTAVDGLEEVVDNSLVPVTAQSGKTYGGIIAEWNAALNKANTDLTTALAATDANHVKGLTDLAASLEAMTITADAETLKGTYDADKAAYEESVVDNAIDRMLNYATDLVDNAKRSLGARDSYTAAELGLRLDEVLKDYDDIMAALNGQSDKIEDASNNNDKTAAMATLNEVNNTLTEINGNIAEFNANVRAIKDDVKANNDQKTAADKAVADVEELLNGNGTDVKGVAELNKDASRKQEFVDLIAPVAAKISTLEGEIAASYAAETLVADWEDVTADDETTTEGYASRLEAIEKEVNDLRDKAEASTANYDAKAEIDKYIEDEEMAQNLVDAQTTVNDETTDPAKTYYTNLIASKTTKLNELKDEALQSYNDRTCATDKAGILNELKVLDADIDAIAKDATANETAHTEQLEKYDEVNKYWSDIYTEISNGDQTSEVGTYLQQLTAEQTKLLNVNSAIATLFGKGQSDIKNDSIMGVLTDINDNIKDIADRQSDNYDDVVAKDNLTRMEAFRTAVANAKTAYANAVDTIQMYSEITNSQLTGTATTAVNTANTAINGLLSELRALENAVEEEYTATVSPALFDENEAHKAEVESLIAQIDGAIDALDNTVSGEARTLFSAAIAARAQELQYAIEALTAAQYDDTVIKNAFADVRKYVADAQAAEDGEHFALTVDAHLNNLDQTTTLITAGKEAAAEAEWAKRLGDVDALIKTQTADLQKFEYVGDTDGSKKQGYIDAYAQHVKDTRDAAVTMAEAVAEGTWFDNLRNVRTQLYTFYTNNPYDAAKLASDAEGANQEAYEAVLVEYNKLQPLLDAAETFVDAYNITDDCGVSTAQSRIDDLKYWMDYRLENGGCVNYRQLWLNECESITSSIALIYDAANTAEDLKVEADIESLKGDQNKAANATVNDSEKAEEVEAYIKTIDDLAKKYSEETGDGNFNSLSDAEKQAFYLGYEAEIAKIRAELAVYYDASLAQTTYQSLLDAIAEIVDGDLAEAKELAGYHQDILDEYSADLDEVTADLDAAKVKVEGWMAEGSILYYEDKAESYITEAAGKLATLKADIATMQAQYKANDDAYAKLTAEVTALTESLDATVEKIGGYIFVDVEAEDYQTFIKTVTDAIAEAQVDLDERHAAIRLDANSTVTGKFVIEYNIAYLDFFSTYSETTAIINYSDTENALLGMLSDVEQYLTSRDINAANGTRKFVNDGELWSAYNDLSEVRQHLAYFNSDAYDGVISYDIDGNQLLDDQELPTSQTIDYMEEALPQINERIAELKEKIAALKTNAEENAYILGDVDFDNEVRVNDYTRILNIALGIDVPEEGSMEYWAADVNEDSDLNIGDLTGVVNIMRGISISGYRVAAAYASAAPADASAGTLRLTADGDGSIKRVAIKLNTVNTYVGFQMDVKLPAGVTLLNETLGGRAADHSLYSNTLADGTHRIVISSMENSEFNAGEEDLVILEVTGRNADRITVTNAMASDKAGMVYGFTGDGSDGATGIEGVEAEKSLKERIYSVGGQVLDTLKRGVNIIRNADGSVKKVIKK